MKKCFLLAVVALCLLPSITFAQVIEWQNTIGGNEIEWLYCMQQTSDGGYILGGWSRSNISGDKNENCIGYDDYWLVKTDSSGIIQWQKTIGGNNLDKLISLEQTTDGGYILGGQSMSDSSGNKTENCIGYNDYWIVKTDSVGNIQWQNTIGGDDSDNLTSVRQTLDGGYILGGTSVSSISGDKTENNIAAYDCWIIKTDSMGNIQWQNTIGGGNQDYLFSIQPMWDGGFIIAAQSSSNISGDKTENSIGYLDYWILKIDMYGNILWQNTIGGSDFEQLRTLALTTDGGFILGGASRSNISGDKTEVTNGVEDYWIVKTDSLGNVQWDNTIGGIDFELLNSIKQTIDGGYILGGYSNSNISGDKTEDSNGGMDYWVIKTDSSGVIQWQNTIGGSEDDELYPIEQTFDGGYLLGGRSESSISSDKTENSIGGADYWIVKILGQPTSIPETISSTAYLQLYPNPAKSTLTIETSNLRNSECRLIISDVAGRMLYSKSITPTSTKHNIDISTLSRGIYFVQLQAGKTFSRGRFVKD